MRLTAVLSALYILSSAATVAAQEWAEFTSRDDGFRVNFPGQPKVAQTTYQSEVLGRQQSADSR